MRAEELRKKMLELGADIHGHQTEVVLLENVVKDLADRIVSRFLTKDECKKDTATSYVVFLKDLSSFRTLVEFTENGLPETKSQTMLTLVGRIEDLGYKVLKYTQALVYESMLMIENPLFQTTERKMKDPRT